METIALANRKGGVGKSTTAAALAAGLTAAGYKVLAIDLDAQCNLTIITDAEGADVTALDVMRGEVMAADAITSTPDTDIIAGSPALLDNDLPGGAMTLRNALAPIGERYDYCIIDCAPSLSLLTLNALTAADYVLIPSQADILSLRGIKDLYEIIGIVRGRGNPSLKVAGILLTRYNPRSVLSRDAREMAEQMAEQIGTRVFRTTIREGIAIKEAQISQQSIFKYAPRAKVTADYKALITELLEKEL